MFFFNDSGVKNLNFRYDEYLYKMLQNVNKKAK